MCKTFKVEKALGSCILYFGAMGLSNLCNVYIPVLGQVYSTFELWNGDNSASDGGFEDSCMHALYSRIYKTMTLLR